MLRGSYRRRAKRLRPVYASVKLRSIVWRGPRQILLHYTLLDGEVGYPPGTFALFWYPGLEAIPLTPIAQGKDVFLLVAVKGKTTARIYSEPPRYAGLIGPLGRPYAPEACGDRVLFVAGGVGVAAVASVARSYAERRGGATLVYGARTSREIPPLEPLLGGRVRVEYATDDGSLGFRGTAVEAAEALVEGGGYDCLVAAGPTPMLCNLYNSKLVELLGPERVVVAVETYVRCGLGFCGKCLVPGVGRRLCIDGMFYNLEKLGRGWRERVCGRM
jgi:dihydroorotate dehydrogenase electron transfer subunit